MTTEFPDYDPEPKTCTAEHYVQWKFRTNNFNLTVKEEDGIYWRTLPDAELRSFIRKKMTPQPHVRSLSEPDVDAEVDVLGEKLGQMKPVRETPAEY